MDKKVILAYSGGLDTTVAISWLKERGYEVIAFSADIGQEKNLKKLAERAKIAGAKKFIFKELKKEFLTGYAFRALQAQAKYEGRYYLATALSRPLIARHLIEIARAEKAQAVAHGCSGKGNDQVRFEVSIRILAPRLEIIAPLRVWELKSREEEILYARRRKIPVELKSSNYSIDRNIWGISIECGILEDIAQPAPEEAFLLTSSLEQAPQTPECIEIEFWRGRPLAINGKRLEAVKLVEKLNRIGARHGIGRVDMVENRLLGIKSREVYEAPAATILYFAHRELESLVLDRETYHFKEQLSHKYAELVYYGLWHTPLREALDSFIEYTQKYVSGKVKLKLEKGNISVLSRESKFSGYKLELATYGKEDIFDHSASEGFMKIWALPYKKRC